MLKVAKNTLISSTTMILLYIALLILTSDTPFCSFSSFFLYISISSGFKKYESWPSSSLFLASPISTAFKNQWFIYNQSEQNLVFITLLFLLISSGTSSVLILSMISPKVKVLNWFFLKTIICWIFHTLEHFI